MTEAFRDKDPTNDARDFVAPEGAILSVEDILEKLRVELPGDKDPMSHLGEVLRDLPEDEESWSLLNVAGRYAYSRSVYTVFGAAMALSKSAGISTESFCQPLREIPATEEDPTPWLGSISPATATDWAVSRLKKYGPEDVSSAFPLVEFLNSYVVPGQDPNVKRAVYQVNPDNRPPFESSRESLAAKNVIKLRQATDIIRRFWTDGKERYSQIGAIAEDISQSDPDLAAALTIRAATALLEAAPNSQHAGSAKLSMDSLLCEATGSPNFAEQSIIVEDAIAEEVKRRLRGMQDECGFDYPSDFSDRELAGIIADANGEVSELEAILKVIGTQDTGFNPKYDYELGRLYGADLEVSFEDWVVGNRNLNSDQKAMAILSNIGEGGDLSKSDFNRNREILSGIEAKENQRRHTLKELGIDLSEAPVKIGSIHNRQPTLHLEYNNLDEVLATLRSYWSANRYDDELYNNRKARIIDRLTSWHDEDVPGEFTHMDDLFGGLTISRAETGVLRISGLLHEDSLMAVVRNGKVVSDKDGYAELTFWPSEDEMNDVLGKNPEDWRGLSYDTFYEHIVSDIQLTTFVDYIHKITGVSYQPEELKVDAINGSLKIESDILSITLMNAFIDEDGDNIQTVFPVSTRASKRGGQQSVRSARVTIKPRDSASQDGITAVYTGLSKLSQGLPSTSRPAKGWRGGEVEATADVSDSNIKAFLKDLSRRSR